MSIGDVNAEMHLGIPEGDDYETVAGFILKLLGHIPQIGEQARFQDLKMVITHMKNMKIEEVRVTKEKHATTADKV
jgi:putative hemolysin